MKSTGLAYTTFLGGYTMGNAIARAYDWYRCRYCQGKDHDSERKKCRTCGAPDDAR